MRTVCSDRKTEVFSLNGRNNITLEKESFVGDYVGELYR